MFIEVSSGLKKLSKYFPENLYVVGGYVRNKLLDLPANDVDIASSVAIDEVAKRLEGTNYSVKVKNLKTGSLLISFGNENFEYTAFRTEIYGNDGSHTPTRVENTKDISKDAMRRDFSINSIYYNINKDEIVDFYHGIVDLKQKIIRCNINPDDVFKNDGERILRLVRFAGELDFKIDKGTLSFAIKHANNVENLQGQRRYSELEKILYCDKKYNLNKKSLKNALNLLNILQIWKYFGINISKIKFDMVEKVEDRFLGLLIDIVDTTKPECLEEFIRNFLKENFAFSEALIKRVFVNLAGYYYALYGMNNKDYFFKFYQDWANISSLLEKKSKRTQNKYNFFYRYIIEHGLVIQIENLEIDENDIKKKFPKIDKRSYDKILTNLWSKVFDGKVQNSKDALLKEIEKNLQNI